ncbi:MAG: hypothetical protein EKK34_12625 [Mycobacterium sp.]|nr:MAG: hypothetical protein EKK34_12625 [Mycobacterium sp.]
MTNVNVSGAPRFEATLGRLRPLMRNQPDTPFQQLGWGWLQVDSGIGDDEGGPPPCPECGEAPATSLHHYWDNVDTDDCHSVDLYWCIEKHMWGKFD